MSRTRSKRNASPLVASFVVIIALFLVFGGITIHGLFSIGGLAHTLYHHPLVVSNASLNAALHITKMHRDMMDVVMATDTRTFENAIQEVAKNEQYVIHELDLVRENILGEPGQALERETRRLLESWRPIREEILGLLAVNRTAEAVRLTQTRSADHVAKIETKMRALTHYARQKATGFLNMTEEKQSHLERVTIVFTLAGVFISVLIAWQATQRVDKAERILLEEKDRLAEALSEIKTLRGIIPICSHCKQIRDDKGSWKRLEAYIQEHSDASFSHGVCPDCLKTYYADVVNQMKVNDHGS